MSAVFQMRSHSVLETNVHNLLSAVKVISSDTRWAHICFFHGCVTAAVHACPTPHWYIRFLPRPFPSVISDIISEIIFDPQVVVLFILLTFGPLLLLISQGHLSFLCDTLVLHCVDHYKLLVSLANAIGKINFFC